MQSFDLVVIGSGPGGFAAAKKAAELGAKVGLIEKDKFGGECLNWGCIPTKALIATAKTYNSMQHLSDLGLFATGVSFDFEKIMTRKNNVVDKIKQGLAVQLKRFGIVTIKGVAKFVSATELEVDNDGACEMICAEKIIIATGSNSRSLDFQDFDGNVFLNSRDILSLERLPDKLLIVGGGAIGCEFAYIFKSLGVDVFVVEREDSLLPGEDSEFPKRLKLSFKKMGIEVFSSTSITEFIRNESSYLARTSTGINIPFDKALISIGRVADFSNLGLEGIDLKYDKFIEVDKYLKTNIDSVYAIGDCIGSPLLAHTATYEGRCAAYNAIKGDFLPINYNCVPSCVYTVPEFASVGFTIDKAKAANLDVKTVKALYTASGKSHCVGVSEGFVKLVYDVSSGRVLGGQIMGENASDLISEIALAVNSELTVYDIAHTIHPHPSFSEIIQDAACMADLNV